MTSLYLNSSPSSFPIPDLNQDQNLHHHHHHLFSNSFFNNTTAPQFQSELLPNFGDSHHHHQVVDHYISHSRLSDPKVPPPPSFEASVNQSGELHERDEVEDHYSEGINTSRRTEGSAKWIPSKTRIMQKMINSNYASEIDHKPLKYTLRFQDHHTNHNESSSSSSQNIIRGCSDCNTTTTPLWRSGPKGPKSLCNACGIRRRKARRAMAAAEAAVGNGMVRAAAETKPSIVQIKKEKKLRTGHVIRCKKLGRSLDLDQLPHKPNISFKNFGFNFNNNNNNDSALHHHSEFPQDVEQAAILLMELSCGSVHV